VPYIHAMYMCSQVPLSALQRQWYKRVLERGQQIDDDEEDEDNDGGIENMH